MQVATELISMEILQYHKLITMDIKGLYVNLPINEIINISN
jgi:hypothetical protein